MAGETFHQSCTCQAMSEQEYFLSVNKHLLFARGAKQPSCSVPPCEHLCELCKGDKKTSTWLSSAPCVYTESWNMFPLLCLELLDWYNYSLLSLKSFKLRQFSAAAALATKVSALGSPVGTAEVGPSVPFG